MAPRTPATPAPTTGLPALPDPEIEPVVKPPVGAKAMGVSLATFYKGIADGTIPSIRIGRKIVVPTAGLRQLLGLDADPDGTSQSEVA